MGIFDRELEGRIARRNIAEYDVLIAEIAEDRMAEKCKVRNRRKADRKHPENKAERMRKMHNRLERKYGYYSCDGGIVHRGFITGELYADGKTRCDERIARSDWELELAEIENDKILADAWRKTMAEIEAQSLAYLNDWLKYA